jgi:phenylpropionate dioxygenase-like ring-hydroxylating dioxygenase large terminal subunit
MAAGTIVRNRWYVAAWDSEVDRNPLSIMVCGERIVLYRRLDRSVVALRDACPHRLLPLSMGLKEGDNLRCKYHGLLVSGDGRCLEMPIASEPPNEALRVQAYPTVERYRFVWVWIGEPEKADPALLPDLWPCEAPDWVFDGGHYRIGCDYRLLIDNLMDLTHETYVHAGSIGQRELMEAAPETRIDGDEVYVTRWIPDIDAPPFWRDALKKPGKVDRWQICRFLAPSTIMIDVGVAPVEAGATVERHDQGVRGMVINCMTPETETSTHYFWGMARNFDVDDPGFTARFKRQQGGVFSEDEVVLEAQQRSIDENPDLRLRTFSIDAGGVRARAVIDRLIRAQTAQPALSQVEPT